MVVFALTTTAGTASAQSAQTTQTGRTYVCAGTSTGVTNIPAGRYRSVIVKGVCSMNAGTVIIRQDLILGPGALLDAVTPGDPTANPTLPATVLVGGNVKVGKGAVLLLGCSPDQGCNGGVNYDRVGGSITGVGDLAVVVHSATIGGDVTLLGGGGGVGTPAAGSCESPPPAPWSSDPALTNPDTGSPVFTDFEDTTIGGRYAVVGVRTCWLGTFRTSIGGSMTLVGNKTDDPDGNEISTDRVGGNMVCLSNLPAVQIGDSGGSPNIVGRRGVGQCGFNVVVPKTPPETSTPVTQMHLTAPAAELRTFIGVHTVTQADVFSLPPVITASGDTLHGQISNAVLAGRGLTGATIPFDPTAMLGSTGEAVLSTTHPNGSSSFTAFVNCSCSFRGHTGSVTIEAYGTTSAKGFTTGTFVIRYAEGALATLAGWGTFTSAHQPANSLLLIEHLAIT
jgi:Protein of unknown function (DUF3224)